MRVYLDATPVIFFIEQPSGRGLKVAEKLSDPDVVRVASDLTRLECRIKPLRNGDANLLREFDSFFNAASIEIIPLSRAVMDAATDIRARCGFKTPDAIHLAAAKLSSCEVFLTNDYRLAKFPDLKIEVIAP